MLSTILRYEIEVFLKLDRPEEAEKDWHIWNTITPKYKYEGFVGKKRFLCWTWSEIHQVIANERKARIQARKKAFRKARRLYPRYDTRVYVVFKFPEIEEPFRHRVWENGRHLSPH